MNGTVDKKKGPLPKKFKKSQVIRAICTMDKETNTQLQTTDTTSKHATGDGSTSQDDKDEFHNSGRVGRRNAMPDILGNNCTASSGGDLPTALSALTTNDSSSQPTTTTHVNETPNQTNNK